MHVRVHVLSIVLVYAVLCYALPFAAPESVPSLVIALRCVGLEGLLTTVAR